MKPAPVQANTGGSGTDTGTTAGAVAMVASVAMVVVARAGKRDGGDGRGGRGRGDGGDGTSWQRVGTEPLRVAQTLGPSGWESTPLRRPSGWSVRQDRTGATVRRRRVTSRPARLATEGVGPLSYLSIHWTAHGLLSRDWWLGRSQTRTAQVLAEIVYNLQQLVSALEQAVVSQSPQGKETHVRRLVSARSLTNPDGTSSLSLRRTWHAAGRPRRDAPHAVSGTLAVARGERH